MHLARPKKIVVLGMMSRMPVAGMVWLTMQYVAGLARLGYDAYYVEAHARTPSTFTEHPEEDGSPKAAAFIARMMEFFGLPGDRWAFHALHSDERVYGLSESQLMDLYRSADLLINLHGGTRPLPEHTETGRLLFLGTDPVEFEIYLAQNLEDMFEYMEPHCAFFTWGENYGKPDCRTPVCDRFDFKPTRQPVVLEMWQGRRNGASDALTTIASWRQSNRDVSFGGEVYYWSKHHQFLKFLELPRHTAQPIELALASYEDSDRSLLEDNGWRVRDAMAFSMDVDAYRQYIADSRGEFTIAKDQYVRPRSGWFSDRSATYLAAGNPVITQDTGFSNHLPTGEGLFAFSTMDEILAAVDAINADYEGHRRAAATIAREHFNYDVVLPRLLAEVGV